ncbi:ATP-binding protein [Paraburkholderia sacchari]|uniref:ATP-binding protein n=1 Tax=Paraburkholderia sacchari TaxID=159450 RepID=UPI0005437B3B|nr:ATP-binding protein [Paraburkholderia sacchari]NLP62665.1 response regulator [Paraburkholderia sacchari]
MNTVPWTATRARTLLQAIALGTLYYLLARPVANLESANSLAAIAWPAPATAIAFLWPLPPRQWFPFLLAVLAAVASNGHFSAESWRSDVGFCLLNVFEVAFCAWLGRRYVGASGTLSTTSALIRFLVLLPLVGIGLTAMLGATFAADLGGDSWWREWQILFVGNGVAVLVLVPALLAWRDRSSGAAPGGLPGGRLSALAGCLAVVTILAATAALHLSEEVQRGVLALVLAAVAIYGGLPAAATTVATAAILGVSLTLVHLGPYQYEGANSSWSLQVDMAGLAILTFFVAVATRERRQLALRLERARRMESLGLLAGGVAHDFNNILAAVDGYAEIAHDRLPEGSSARPALDEVRTASARGRDLTEQILLAARRGDRVREMLELASVVGEAVALARPLSRNGVVIDIEANGGPWPVAAHRGQLVRAVLNLVRNACLAARSRVVVRVASAGSMAAPLAVGDTPPGSAVWIEVEDDGAGIPAEHLVHLFEPFYSTRAQGSGTGLGLAIVAGVACEHQGGVSVETSGTGTRFRLVLPLAEAAPSPRAGQLGNGEAVVLIGGDPASRERSENWLAELGFEPLGYGDASEAFEALADATDLRDSIALLLADLDGLSMDGADLAEHLREQVPALRVILCSDNSDVVTVARAARATVLPKPFDREALGRAAASALKTLP